VSEYLSWSLLVSAVFFAAQVVLSVRVLLRRSPLQNAHAWLLVLWLLPLAGMVLYLLIGENRLGSLRRKQYSDSQRHLAAWANELWLAKEKTWEDGYERFRTLAHLGVTMCDAPAVEGNRLTLHADAGETLDAMIADINRAESHCHLLTYIFYPEGKPLEVAEALERAVARGVSCRVAVDSAGSRKFFRSGLASRLRSSGVEVLELLGVNPLRLLFRRLDLRNHRKLLIVDGMVAYAGSHNMADDSFRPKGPDGPGPWHDATARVEGYAARALALLFIADWNSEASSPIGDVDAYLPPRSAREPDDITSAVQILPSGPESRPGAIQATMVSAMHLAERELIVTTPYFVPDATLMTALVTASARGVETTLIVPARNDAPIVDRAGKASYARLLDAGVRILRYTPGLLHAKTVTVDGKVALIGSANMDQRSFRINFEVTLAVYDDPFASTLRSLQHQYIAQSEPVEPADWNSRSVGRKLVDNAAALFGPLL
jgi:cardiolipin synthase